MPHVYVDLAIPDTVDKLFTYAVPLELQDAVKPGIRVTAPFGKRPRVGFVVTTSTRPPAVSGIKMIQDVLDTEPLISEQLLNLTKWMSEYYFAPLGDVLKASLFQGATHTGKRMVKLVHAGHESSSGELIPTPKQAAIIRELSTGGLMSEAYLRKKIGGTGLNKSFRELAQKGYISIEETNRTLYPKQKYESVVVLDDDARNRLQHWIETPRQSAGLRQRAVVQKLMETPTDRSTVTVSDLLKESHASLTTLRSLEKKLVITIARNAVTRTTPYELYASSLGTTNIILNQHQRYAVDQILSGIQKNSFHVFLLHGVTGSGKTQIYIESIRDIIARGKTAIVLVPEISLTPQIVRRFKLHFGEQVAALHSKMSTGERYEVWRKTNEGTYSIVIGARSVVFAPLNNIGLIVVDEEQEPSYKQYDQNPRYHARDVAIMRANQCNAVVVLGSATPSLESYTNALSGKYTLLELPERVDSAKLPHIEIIDMAAERQRELHAFREQRKAEWQTNPQIAREEKRVPEFSLLSKKLQEKIEDRLCKKEGIIILQNRRGFSAFVECIDCGHVEMCENCSISLTYHRVQHHLRCHYCGMVKHPPELCPKCQSSAVSFRGIGTQRVEEEIGKLFPAAKILRMDLDTTTTRGSHDTILRKFSDGEIDILLGTQMVAKGLDFARVTLVGVISAETQMLLPDFRSSERTFQLLTQVAGRAGRSNLAGEVIIQTYIPGHESLQYVLNHDFKAFYNNEIEYRKELHYAPFSHITLLEFKGKNEDDVKRNANYFAELLRRQNSHVQYLGPSPAVIAKLNGLFRWHILIKDVKGKGPSRKRFRKELRAILSSYQNSPVKNRNSVRLTIDVDAVGMM